MPFLQPFLTSIGFFTRLRLPARFLTEAPLAQSAWAFPLAGTLIGLLTALVLIMAETLGVTPYIAGWLALAFQLGLTGGLHEDGLADMADGLACGRSCEEKLAIMKDSRIGSYGVMALVVALVLRALTMAMLFGNLHILFSLMAVGACSRAMLPALMYLLPQARSGGLAMRAGKPSLQHVLASLGIGLALLLLATPLRVALLAALVLTAVAVAIMRLAQRHFGGVTGDVLGAAQQAGEVTLLVILSI